MKKKINKKFLFIFFCFIFGTLVFRRIDPEHSSKKHIVTDKSENEAKAKNSSNPVHQESEHVKSIPHHHSHSTKDSKINRLKMTETSRDKKYKKQINNYKKRYLKFLSPKIKSEITVKKELDSKLVLLVRTINENSLAQSFEAIVDKTTGKLIVNQGFTINENAKLPRFSPSGVKLNP